MTRRNFLSSVLAGAAALVGVKLLPKEEAKALPPRDWTAADVTTFRLTKGPTPPDVVCRWKIGNPSNIDEWRIEDLSGNGRHLLGANDNAYRFVWDKKMGLYGPPHG